MCRRCWWDCVCLHMSLWRCILQRCLHILLPMSSNLHHMLISICWWMLHTCYPHPHGWVLPCSHNLYHCGTVVMHSAAYLISFNPIRLSIASTKATRPCATIHRRMVHAPACVYDPWPSLAVLCTPPSNRLILSPNNFPQCSCEAAWLRRRESREESCWSLLSPFRPLIGQLVSCWPLIGCCPLPASGCLSVVLWHFASLQTRALDCGLKRISENF